MQEVVMCRARLGLGFGGLGPINIPGRALWQGLSQAWAWPGPEPGLIKVKTKE